MKMKNVMDRTSDVITRRWRDLNMNQTRSIGQNQVIALAPKQFFRVRACIILLTLQLFTSWTCSYILAT